MVTETDLYWRSILCPYEQGRGGWAVRTWKGKSNVFLLCGRILWNHVNVF